VTAGFPRIVTLSMAVIAAMVSAPAHSGPGGDRNEQLWRHRNLGKAFYENPTTHAEAVEQFKTALDLAPDSSRERLNYALALLRAGRTDEGISELERVQRQDPSIPHTWFNLGIEYKRRPTPDYERAIRQLEGMARLVPDEPVTRYNLGVLYKLTGRGDDALAAFELAARLAPQLAGPHFQLYNAYREPTVGRAADAARERKRFEELKRAQAGAAVPEDLEWSAYSEIYDPVATVPDVDDNALTVAFDDRVLAKGMVPKPGGVAALDVDGDGRPDLLVWSAAGVRVWMHGSTPSAQPALADLHDIVSVAPGDYDNDGLPDVAVLTASAAVLYHNRDGVFERVEGELARGRFAKAVWLDSDHDYDLDLLLFGDTSRFLLNSGQSGFVDRTDSFPFVSGIAVDAVPFRLLPDTPGFDVLVTYRDREAVLYRDRLLGRYEVMPVHGLPSNTRDLTVADLNQDGWPDVVADSDVGAILATNRNGRLEVAPLGEDVTGPLTFADFGNRGALDLFVAGSIYRSRQS